MDNVIKLNFEPLAKAVRVLDQKKGSLASDQVLEIMEILNDYFNMIEPGQHEGLDEAAKKLKEASFWLAMYVEE